MGDSPPEFTQPPQPADCASARQARSLFSAYLHAIRHELQAPLRSIEGFSQLLSRTLSVQTQQATHPHLERILASVAQLNQRVEALTALSSLYHHPFEPAEIDLTEAFTEAFAQLQRAQPERSVQLDLGPPRMIWADPHLLARMVRELAENAWKFTRDRPEAQIRLTDHPHGYAVGLQDNGTGFEPSRAATIFQPFSRAHHSRNFEGLGIGLSVVDQIVHLHGGQVHIEAGLDQGCTLWFSLPIGPQRSCEPALPAES